MIILHISDLHFRTNSTKVSFLPLYQAINHKICNESKIVFVFSGDIAFSGISEEYVIFDKAFKEMLDKMYKDCPEAKTYRILVPGNHDCDFGKNDVRDIIVNKIKEDGCNLKDDDMSIISTCTSVQNNFFEYQSKAEEIDEKKDIDRLAWQTYIEDDNTKLLITSYNTAWLSSEIEDAGSLYYPTEVFANLKTEIDTDTFKLGVYHHPDNWISPKHDEYNHKEFKKNISSYNNLVFTGHEHREQLSQFNDLSNGYDCFIHESNAYYQNNSFGGFSVIEIKDNSNLHVEEYKYNPTQKIFYLSDSINKNLENIGSISHNYELTKDYRQYLSDTDVYIANAKSNNLILKEIYTYPNLENIETEKITSAEKILKDMENEKIIVFGSEQTGKTSLLKMIYSYWYYHGATPILLNAKNDIHNSNIRQVIKNAYKKQYSIHKTSYEKYLTLDLSKKIIFVDNLHLLKKSLNREDIINEIKKFSNKIVITADDISSLEEAFIGAENDAIFTRYSLLPFGHVNRDELITKWLFAKEGITEDIFSKKKIIYDRVNDIIGTNLVPSYPFFIITILQALENTLTYNTEITSYGHCYHTLIYLSFKNLGLEDNDFDAIDNFLAFLGYKMYEDSKSYLSRESINEVLTQYKNKYVMTSDISELIDILISSKTLSEESENNFTFKYIYIYYYYVAKYVAKYKIDEKSFIEKLCSNIEDKENAFILLFITHHSHDSSVIEDIIINTMSQLDNYAPITLIEEETNFMFKTVESISSTVLNDIEPEDYRQKELQARDLSEQQSKQNDEIDGDISDINKALKSIEINGQILKNRYGSIDINRITQVVEESFLICFRLIRFLVEDLSKEDTVTILVDQFQEYIRINESKVSSNPTRDELIKVVKGLLSNITYYITHYALDKTAFFIGNEKIMHIYNNVAMKINTPAAHLTYMLISMKFKRTLDKQGILDLKKQFENNSFAFSILQKTAVNYIYMHKLSHTEKSWIASTLNIPIVSQRIMENKKNK